MQDLKGWLAIPRSHIAGDPAAKGWFKLHRSLLTHPIFTQCSAIVLKVWLICLGQANWQETKWFDGRQQITIPPGAFIFTQVEFAKFCHITRDQLRTALQTLQKLQSVTIRSTNKDSVLVIENWGVYQTESPTLPQPSPQQIPSGSPTLPQQIPNCYKEEELRRENEEHTQAIVRVSKPLAADLNGQTSQRWKEFWGKYPRKQRKDFAARNFVSYVTVENEVEAFVCLERYLASSEVARGVVMNPDRWLYEQHCNGWAGDWPARKKTIDEIIEEMPDV